MPGMEARAPERTETSKGFAASPNLRPVLHSWFLASGYNPLGFKLQSWARNQIFSYAGARRFSGIGLVGVVPLIV